MIISVHNSSLTNLTEAASQYRRLLNIEL